MSEWDINMDFQKALAEADKVDSSASSISSMVKGKYESSIQTLSTNWKGAGAEKYLKKCTALQTNLNGVASNMKRVASTIRTQARIIYDAEMEALRIAREREAALARAEAAAAAARAAAASSSVTQKTTTTKNGKK